MTVFERMHVAIVITMSRDRQKPDERGAAMVEYGLLVAFIAVIALVAVKALGTKVSTLFTNISFA